MNLPTVDTSSSPRYVACLSYPRSGHHLTVRILQQYFEPRFQYCRFYGLNAQECCGQFPCARQQVTLTKNHDMELGQSVALGVPKIDGVPYLILVRNFLEAVVSDYALFLRTHEDSLANWHGFVQRKMEYYRRFVQKWVLTDDGLEKLVVRYEDLTADPAKILARVVAFFRPLAPIDTVRLQATITEADLEVVEPQKTDVIERFGVRSRRRIEDFQHYDPDYFAQIESLLSRELSEIGYGARYAA